MKENKLRFKQNWGKGAILKKREIEMDNIYIVFNLLALYLYKLEYFTHTAQFPMKETIAMTQADGIRRSVLSQ